MDLSETVKTPDPNVRYIVAGGVIVKLHRNERDFWEDFHGTEYSFTESKNSVDDKVRAGVGFFSLSENHPLSLAARAHDHAYSSLVYQAYHSRTEADRDLERCISLVPFYGATITPQIFHFLSRQFGGEFWENKTTND